MKVSIKRAPASTPWAAVVAEQLGFDSDQALSLCKALAQEINLSLISSEADDINSAEPMKPDPATGSSLLRHSVSFGTP